MIRQEVSATRKRQGEAIVNVRTEDWVMVWRKAARKGKVLRVTLPHLWWFSGKELTRRCRGQGFDTWVRKILWRRKSQPAPVGFQFLAWKTVACWATVHGVTKSRTQLSD